MASIPDQFAIPAQTPRIFLLALSSTRRDILIFLFWRPGVCGGAVSILFSVQATKAEAGAIAGATLIPIVMNAQNTAAKIEAIWVREKMLILNLPSC